MMRAKTIFVIAICVLASFYWLIAASIAQDTDWTRATEVGESLSPFNSDFRTYGEVGTYEDYISSRPLTPFSAELLTPMPLSQFNAYTIIVFVENSIYQSIKTEISNYTTDLAAEGYFSMVINITGATAEDLKDIMVDYYTNASYDLVGAVLVGDLPCAWYYHSNDFYGGDTFPCDLFLMDLNGTWTDGNSDGTYDSHTDGAGDTAPDIFLGRIDTSNVPGNEVSNLKDYFAKSHRFHSGQTPRTFKGLTYTDHDWAPYSDFLDSMGFAYDDYDAFAWPAVDRADYVANRVPNATYEFIQLSCHSSSNTHYFNDGGTASSTQLRAAPPESLFYNLYCCSGARFTDYDCLGNAYIMDTGTDSLASIGSTKTGSMLDFYQFYSPLGKGCSFGEAFRQWFAAMAPYSDTAGGDNDISWFYGMALLGDPTALIIRPDTVYVDDDFGPDTYGWGVDHFANLSLAIQRVKEGGTVKVYNGTYSGPVVLDKYLRMLAQTPTPKIQSPAGLPGVIISSENMTVAGFDVMGQSAEFGISIHGDNATLSNCNVTGFKAGALLSRVVNATLYQDSVEGGILLLGSGPEHFDSHTLEYCSNGIEPIVYWLDKTDTVLPAPVGQVILVNCTNITLSGLTLDNCYAPLQVHYSSRCRLENSTISGCVLGAVVAGDNNTLSDNVFHNNTGFGLVMAGERNLVLHNNFLGNGKGGKQASDSGVLNRFDNGYEGNHWSDWTAPDVDGNGIVDLAYVLNGTSTSKDNFPLTTPWDQPRLSWEDRRAVYEDSLYISNFSVGNTNDNLFWRFSTSAQFLSLYPNGTLMGTPANEHVGAWWVNVSVAGPVNSDFVNFTLTVVNVNDPPVIGMGPMGALTEDESFYYDMSAQDIDPTSDILTWHLATNCTFLSIDISTGNLTGMPENSDVGPWWANVSVDDGLGGWDILNWTFVVKNVNDPPVIDTDPTIYCPQGSDYSQAFSAIDPDKDDTVLTWAVLTNALFLAFDPDNATLSGTPGNDDVGTWWVNVTVQDSSNGLDWLYYEMIVNNTNDAPRNPVMQWLDTEHLAETPQHFFGNATDIDLKYGDALTFDWYLNGSKSGTGQILVLNLTAGNYGLTLNVTDKAGAFCTASMVLTIDPKPLPPPITDDDTDDDVNVSDDDVNVTDDDIQPPDDDDDTGLGLGAYLLIISFIILVVLIVIILAVILLLRRSGKKNADSEGQKKPPQQEDAPIAQRPQNAASPPARSEAARPAPMPTAPAPRNSNGGAPNEDTDGADFGDQGLDLEWEDEAGDATEDAPPQDETPIAADGNGTGNLDMDEALQPEDEDDLNWMDDEEFLK